MMELSGQGWIVHAVGWTLLHFCWQGAAVAGLLWCVLGLMGGKGTAMRYGAACCALGLMVAAPVVTFLELAAEARRAGMAGVVPVVGWMVTVAPGAAARDGVWMGRVAAGLDAATPWLPWVWLAGVVVFLARLNVGLLVARGLKGSGSEEIPGELAERFEAMKTRLGVRRVVKLLRSARVQAPTVIGWLRPVVLMPVGCLARLSTAQVEALLVHELAHIRRHDYLVNVLQSMVEAVLFYHPAVWWVSKQVRWERECRCDRMAVEVGGDALGYAKALSFLETRRAFLQDVALGADGGVLTMRIKRLLGYRESSAVSQGAAFALLAAAIVGPGMYMATAARAASPGAWAGRAMAAPVETVSSVVTGEVAGEGMRPVALAVSPVETPAAQRVSGGVMAGQLVSHPNPVYPQEAKEARVSGSVVLKAVISRDGVVEDLQVVSGPEMLRTSALDAVRQWVYKPYLLNGEPQEVETTITVNFRLGGGSGTDTPGFPSSGGSSSSTGAGHSDGASGSAGASGSSGSSAWGAPVPATGGGYVPGPRQVPDTVMAGQMLTAVNPVYPAEAKAKGLQGAVVLRALITREGKVRELALLSEPSVFTTSALDAVRQWVYKPYLLNGEPQEVETTITVNFALRPPPSGPMSVIDGAHAPVVMHMEDPVYTEEARAKKISGSVLIHLVVDEKGDPTQVQVVRGIGHGLDEKALAAVKMYKFKPAMRDGQPVMAAVNLEVDFKIF